MNDSKKISITTKRLLDKFDLFCKVYNNHKNNLDNSDCKNFVKNYMDNINGDFVSQGMGNLYIDDIMGQIEYSKDNAKKAIKYYIELYLALSTC